MMPDTSRVFSGWLIGALLRWRTHALEGFLAVEALLLGLWMIQPWLSTFGAIPEAYTLLGLVPEWVLGAVWTTHGAASLWALWRTMAHQKMTGRLYWVGWCRRSALASVALWSLMLASFLAAVPGSTATPVYLGLVLASAWVYLRLYLRYG